MFAAGLTIKRQRLERELVVMPIDHSRAEVRAIEKYLQVRSRLDLRVVGFLFRRRFPVSFRFLAGGGWDRTRGQNCHDKRQRKKNPHIDASL